MATRAEVSSRATILLGYIPVAKLANFSEDRKSDAGAKIFHDCMYELLKPLEDAGKNGVDMTCSDGYIRKVYPILAAYVADYPEQCLVCCTPGKRCPKGTVEYAELGHPHACQPRDRLKTLHAIQEALKGRFTEEFLNQGLQPINPFWRDLPHCDIFECITPDLLHQLHKGVFGDHLSKWLTKCVSGGKPEIDRRFKAIPRQQGVRHFSEGTSSVTQWTGGEYRNMEKVAVGVFTGGTRNPAVMDPSVGIIDFTFRAHRETQTDRTLEMMENDWKRFHQTKDAFSGIRKHFNIPKIHSMMHYVPSIRSRGSAGQFNTETSERLHIDYAKTAYRASNRKSYMRQMAVWLSRQEAVDKFTAYLQWVVQGYRAETRLDQAADPMGKCEEETEAADPMYQSEEETEEAEEDLLSDDSESEDNDSEVRHIVAKVPGCGLVDVNTIMHNFGASSFRTCWTSFAMQHFPRSYLAHDAPPNTRFPVYNSFQIVIPPLHQVSRKPLKDIVRARPGRSRNGLKQSVLPQFDTVLAYETKPRIAQPAHGFGG
jgi:hypothetical protein